MSGHFWVAVKIVNRLYVDFVKTRLLLEALTFQICLVTYKIKKSFLNL